MGGSYCVDVCSHLGCHILIGCLLLILHQCLVSMARKPRNHFCEALFVRHTILRFSGIHHTGLISGFTERYPPCLAPDMIHE